MCAQELPAGVVIKATNAGIKINRKVKAFIVKYMDTEKKFHFGFKNGGEPFAALDKAIGAQRSLHECMKLAGSWKNDACKAFLQDQGLKGLTHMKVAEKREHVTHYLWKERLDKSALATATSTESSSASSSKPTKIPVKEVKDQQPVEATEPSSSSTSAKSVPVDGDGSAKPSSNGAHSKSDPHETHQSLFNLPGKTAPKNPMIEDVTKGLFCPTANTDASELVEFLANKEQVIIPRVTVVKFLEAVNASPESLQHQVRGCLLGKLMAKQSRAYRGCHLVQTLFVNDVTSNNDVNQREERQWQDAHPSLPYIGRPVCMLCVHVCVCAIHMCYRLG